MNPPTSNDTHPRLRALDGSLLVYEGMKYLHLRDPLEVSGKTLLVPQPLIPILALIDGTRDVNELKAAMARRSGLNLTVDQIVQFVTSLDEALYLDNQHYRLSRQALTHQFAQADCRPATHAGRAYPDDREQLLATLDEFFSHSSADPAAPSPSPRTVRGILSPHIDYERGGEVYARVWSQAARSARSVEQVILLGTDHFSEGFPFSLTHLDYCTPLGRLSTRQDLVDGLADILGAEPAFAGELHHRSEHSIELAAVWLQYILGERPVSFLPVLCGPLSAFEDPGGELHHNRLLDDLVALLANAAAQKPTWVVAAGDLSHVGPAFGGEKVAPADLSGLHDSDQLAIEPILQGDAAGFYRRIQQTGDRTNICGTSPIYLALRILGQANGANHGYAVCPADTENTSFVSVCGLTWT